MNYTFFVYYLKPDHFRDGICGEAHADPADLEKTHVRLRMLEVHKPWYAEADDTLTIEEALEEAFRAQQGEVWSRNGEARALIEQKGLKHTSMSVGDVLVTNTGDIYEVASVGFRKIGKRSTWSVIAESPGGRAGHWYGQPSYHDTLEEAEAERERMSNALPNWKVFIE